MNNNNNNSNTNTTAPINQQQSNQNINQFNLPPPAQINFSNNQPNTATATVLSADNVYAAQLLQHLPPLSNNLIN